MFCVDCGFQVKDDAKFCPNCGKAIGNAAPSSNIAAAPITYENMKSPVEASIWESVAGEAQTLTLGEHTIEIDAKKDRFNTYRGKFRTLAASCADAFRAEYCQYVRDLDSFMLCFPTMYGRHLVPMIEQAVGILVNEGIWTVTEAQLTQEQLSSFGSAFAPYNKVLDAVDGAIEQAANKYARFTTWAPNLIFDGRGVGGAITDGLTAFTANMIHGAIIARRYDPKKLKDEQKVQLYASINFDALLLDVFYDYLNVATTWARVAAAAGFAIYAPENEDMEKAAAVYTNMMENPRFPADKRGEACMELMKLFPYKPEYQKALVNELRDDAENAIKYFGYEDLSNPRCL